jgi:gamma-glutamyl:cysteine ligase YbdK (ATP-grasp superfamily)
VQHVIELKTAEPTPDLAPLAGKFQEQVRAINSLLGPLGAALMPTAMHPWMDPSREMRLWPYGYKRVYETFDRIFSCTGHGWSNLQSMHINLPFQGDEEFARLHAAIRMVLPIIPAIAASSPIVEGRSTGLMDTRMDVYRGNSRRIPSVAGSVIPEPVFSRHAYHTEILERIWADLAPHDPEGVLRFEWANSRGCIARFDRSAIEIRVIDAQECPAADLAVCGAVVGVVKALATGVLGDQQEMRRWAVEPLHKIFLSCIRDADETMLAQTDYLGALGVSERGPILARQAWVSLCQRAGVPIGPELGLILEKGCLARRIMGALRVRPGTSQSIGLDELRAVYTRLCECLAEGRLFEA